MSWVIILVLGALATALLYVPPGVDYWRKSDGYAVNVTVLAAFATLILFVGFAAMAHSAQQALEFAEQRAADDAAFERDMDALTERLLANAQ